MWVDVVRLWLGCRGGEMSAGHLPEPGGALDQGAWLSEAFAVIAVAWDAWGRDGAP